MITIAELEVELAHMAATTNQNAFVLNDKELDDTHAATIAAALEANPKITILNLSGNQNITCKTIETLSSSPNNLQELYLGRMSLDDTAAIFIATLPKLTTLDLTDTDLTDEGIQQILEKLPLLQTLKLNNNPNITDETLAAIAKHRTLTHVEIDAPYLTDAGAGKLLQNKKLVYLRLTYDGMDSTLADQLQAHAKGNENTALVAAREKRKLDLTEGEKATENPAKRRRSSTPPLTPEHSPRSDEEGINSDSPEKITPRGPSNRY